MNTSKAVPLTKAQAEWYAHLRIVPPPAVRGIHRIYPVSPTHTRYAIVAGDGTPIWDGTAREPVTAAWLAHMEAMLELSDPTAAPARSLKIVR